MTQPLFLMGLPKSGTTMLQRVLARHSKISSASEPWILLPPLHALKGSGSFSEFGSRSCFHALNNTIEALPNKRRDYQKAVAAMAQSLYDDLSQEGDAYFLDKTPRYHLIADELIDTFPTSRFIFIWRNPLSVMASAILHNDNKLRGLRFSEFDLTEGYDNLTRAHEHLGERALSLSYEAFVAAPDQEIEKIMRFLELTPEAGQTSDFSKVLFTGGDRNGIERTRIETSSLARWKTVLNTPARRRLAQRILAKIDAAPLTYCGYQKPELIQNLNSLRVRRTLSTYSEYVELAAAEVYVRMQGQAARSGDPASLLY